MLAVSAASAVQSELQVAPFEWLPCLHDIDTAKDLENWLSTTSCLRRLSSRERGMLRSRAEGQGHENTQKKALTRLQLFADWLLYEKQLVEEAMAETGYTLEG